MTCDRADLNIETNDFRAEGRVRGTTADGQHYSAPWVEYDHEAGLLHTSAPVVMVDRDGHLPRRRLPLPRPRAEVPSARQRLRGAEPMMRAVFSCIALAMSVAVGFSAAAADAPATARRASIAIAVAPFERDAPPGAALPDIETLLADRIGTQGVQRVVGPGELAVEADAEPADETVRAWAKQAEVAVVVVGRITRIGNQVSVDVRLRSGETGEVAGTYVAEVLDAERLETGRRPPRAPDPRRGGRFPPIGRFRRSPPRRRRRRSPPPTPSGSASTATGPSRSAPTSSRPSRSTGPGGCCSPRTSSSRRTT